MIWSDELIARLGLSEAAASEIPWRLEHFPELISDRALRASPTVVAEHVEAVLRAGRSAVYEVLSMPKGSAGARPIVYPDIATRLAYHSLVFMRRDRFDRPSRLRSNREDFAKFGATPAAQTYVVVADIASCYEYVVPSLLADELLLRTDDFAVVNALHQLLVQLSTLGRGIPQMMAASDVLSDAYLSRVDRALDRAGLSWKRTADDYKIVCPSWDAANSSLELLESEVRKLGLILSASKTTIVIAGPKAASMASGGPADPFFDEDQDEEEVEGQNDAELSVSHLVDWWGTWRDRRSEKTTTGLAAPPVGEVELAKGADEVLPKELLVDLVFADPAAMEKVVDYLVSRVEDPGIATWVIEQLVGMGRQTAWAKIWLLWAISELQIGMANAVLTDFLNDCTQDRRETIRAEATWIMATRGTLEPDTIRNVHAQATTLTEAGLTASLAVACRHDATPRRSRSTLSQILAGVQGGGAVNFAARRWGEMMQ